MMDTSIVNGGTVPLAVEAKKTYSTPALTVFGQVGRLTQGASTCGDNDSSSCTPGATTMGPMNPSERRLKQNITRIGTHPDGFGLYLFEYKPELAVEWGPGRHFGVMVDEVERIHPEAVVRHPDGYRMVDYGRLGIKTRVH